jgi:hypothetical protein
MELGLSNVIQAVILAACTWYMRRGSVKDREDVKQHSSSPEDVQRVRQELAALRAEFEVLKAAFFQSGLVKLDHRGPKLKGEKP